MSPNVFSFASSLDYISYSSIYYVFNIGLGYIHFSKTFFLYFLRFLVLWFTRFSVLFDFSKAEKIRRIEFVCESVTFLYEGRGIYIIILSSAVHAHPRAQLADTCPIIFSGWPILPA